MFLLSGYVVNALVLVFVSGKCLFLRIDLVFLMQNFDCHSFKFGSRDKVVLISCNIWFGTVWH